MADTAEKLRAIPAKLTVEESVADSGLFERAYTVLGVWVLGFKVQGLGECLGAYMVQNLGLLCSGRRASFLREAFGLRVYRASEG